MILFFVLLLIPTANSASAPVYGNGLPPQTTPIPDAALNSAKPNLDAASLFRDTSNVDTGRGKRDCCLIIPEVFTSFFLH